MDAEPPAPDPRPTRARISIDERAARRRELNRRNPDRYSALVDQLTSTRTSSLGPATDVPGGWHPIARQLVIGALVVVALIAVLYAVSSYLREGRIDTWSGPTQDVTSGQRVLACLPAGTPTDSYLPTWVRYDGKTFAATHRTRALLGDATGETGQRESGYRLDRMRILLPAEVAAGEPLPHVYVLIEPGPGATVFRHAPDCD